MKAILIFTVLVLLFSGGGVLPVQAEAVSIFEIQYSTEADGASPKHGEVVNCIGGVVTHKRTDSRPRLILQDTIIRDYNEQDVNCCWGAIQVKDWYNTTFDGVAVGDWVEFSNVTVEDYRGMTFLQYWNANPDSSVPSFAIVSHNNEMPEYVEVDINEISSPVEDMGDPGCWYVIDHRAEKYESMRVRIKDVSVTEKGNGKASDNYTLQSVAEPNDANFSCWAADYMNADAVGDYHPYVEIGERFCEVEGIVEQYKNLVDGWDYYQLLTTKTEDFAVSQAVDFDYDCDVDFFDYGYFARYWFAECYSDPNLCGRADTAEDGVVDACDLEEFAYYWLEGTD